MRMRISLIAAIGKNKALGKNNDLIYKIPEDLKRFRQITSGHPIIMGRKTFESIGRPLPNRTNIIITREPNYKVDGAIIVHSLDEALKLAKDNDETFIIGGGQIFEQSIDIADRLYLTIVEDNPQADVFFPDYSQFSKVISEEPGQFENYKYKFQILEKP